MKVSGMLLEQARSTQGQLCCCTVCVAKHPRTQILLNAAACTDTKYHKAFSNYMYNLVSELHVKYMKDIKVTDYCTYMLFPFRMPEQVPSLQNTSKRTTRPKTFL